jgi:competence protein ComEC
MNFAPMPFLRIGVILVLSIVLTEKTDISSPLFYSLFTLCGIICLSIIVFSKQYVRLAATCKGVLLSVLVFAFGVLITFNKQQQLVRQKLPCYDRETITLRGILKEELKSSRGIRYIAEISAIRDCDGIVMMHESKVIASFKENDGGATFYKTGDRVTIRGKIFRISKPSNPGAFDYASYMYYQDITHQVSVGVGEHCIQEEQEFVNGFHYASNTGNYASSIFGKYLADEHKYLADALLLGRRADLDDKLYDLFSVTGCIHVLSVSGMHVAIFAAPLLYLITRVRKATIWQKLLQVLVLIGLIWFYVVLTGSSPSVVRSGAMISILCISQVLSKRTTGIHILFLTLVVMLIINPYYLFQLSFQFSFLSLLSLQVFYKAIRNVFIHEWQVVNYIWEITAASLAAQILILPVSIFYFHMFPVYFIAGSIIAVPLVSLIIYAGTLLVIFESVSASLNILISYCMNTTMEFLLLSMKFIVGLPFSALRGLYLSPMGLIFFMAAVFSFLVWFKRSDIKVFYGCLAMFFCGLAENSWHSMGAVRHQEIIVYDLRSRDQLLIDIIQGKQAHCISSLPYGHRNEKFASENYRIKRRLNKIQYRAYECRKGSYAFSLGDFNVLILSGFYKAHKKVQNRNSVQMLYIAGNMWDSHFEIYNEYKPDYIVLHSAVSRKEYSEWAKVQQYACFILHDCKNEGAFKIKL